MTLRPPLHLKLCPFCYKRKLFSLKLHTFLHNRWFYRGCQNFSSSMGDFMPIETTKLPFLNETVNFIPNCSVYKCLSFLAWSTFCGTFPLFSSCIIFTVNLICNIYICTEKQHKKSNHFSSTFFVMAFICRKTDHIILLFRRNGCTSPRSWHFTSLTEY